MLELRPDCKRCGADLPPAAKTQIYSFESTFCVPCRHTVPSVCPNCGGNQVARPIRPPGKLAAYPPSAERRFIG